MGFYLLPNQNIFDNMGRRFPGVARSAALPDLSSQSEIFFGRQGEAIRVAPHPVKTLDLFHQTEVHSLVKGKRSVLNENPSDLINRNPSLNLTGW